MTLVCHEPIPHFSKECVPPQVLGIATLTTAAMDGADFTRLSAMIAERDSDPSARFFDMAIALQLAFRRAEGLDVHDDALSGSTLFRIRRTGSGSGTVRVLALLRPGELMDNTPLDFITNHLDVRLDLLFLRDGERLPAVIPDHDVLFCAVGVADTAVIERLDRLLGIWPRPVLNDPRLIPALERDQLAASLAGFPGICSPPVVAASRDELNEVCEGRMAIGTLLPGAQFPVLVRPHGSHAGRGLKRIDDAAALSSYLLFSFVPSYFVAAFVDYRSADGLFRKYRIAFIDREPHLCHMAASENWMVHYLNAGMIESAAKRDDEARAMAAFDTNFGARHHAAFTALHEVLPFDYYSIDCAELQDGRLLVFEADNAAIIHMMDPEEVFPYKHRNMRTVFDAFGRMLRRHMQAAPEVAARAWRAG